MRYCQSCNFVLTRQRIYLLFHMNLKFTCESNICTVDVTYFVKSGEDVQCFHPFKVPILFINDLCYLPWSTRPNFSSKLRQFQTIPGLPKNAKASTDKTASIGNTILGLDPSCHINPVGVSFYLLNLSTHLRYMGLYIFFHL